MTCGIVVQTFTVWWRKTDGNSQWFLPIPTRTHARAKANRVRLKHADTRWPTYTHLSAQCLPSCHWAVFYTVREFISRNSPAAPVWRAARKSSGIKLLRQIFENDYLNFWKALISYSSVTHQNHWKKWYRFITHYFPFVTHPSSVESTLKLISLILCLFLPVMFCVVLLTWYRRPPICAVAAMPCQFAVFPVRLPYDSAVKVNKSLASESFSTEKYSSVSALMLLCSVPEYIAPSPFVQSTWGKAAGSMIQWRRHYACSRAYDFIRVKCQQKYQLQTVGEKKKEGLWLLKHNNLWAYSRRWCGYLSSNNESNYHCQWKGFYLEFMQINHLLLKEAKWPYQCIPRPLWHKMIVYWL